MFSNAEDCHKKNLTIPDRMLIIFAQRSKAMINVKDLNYKIQQIRTVPGKGGNCMFAFPEPL